VFYASIPFLPVFGSTKNDNYAGLIYFSLRAVGALNNAFSKESGSA
jgi:hypothetical protein